MTKSGTSALSNDIPHRRISDVCNFQFIHMRNMAKVYNKGDRTPTPSLSFGLSPEFRGEGGGSVDVGEAEIAALEGVG